MTSNQALQKIDDNKKLKSPFLDLSYLKLTEIPEEVYSLVWLTELYLNSNFLNEIDAERFRQLKYLSVLDLRNNLFNHLSGLPFPFGSISNLKK